MLRKAELSNVVFSLIFPIREPLPRGIGNEPNSKFLDSRQHFLFRISEPERVFALDRGHRLDGVSSPNRLCPSSRKAEMLTISRPGTMG